MDRSKHILIAEDDPSLSYLLKTNLEQEGYTISLAGDGMEGWTLFTEGTFDLCVLDIMLPKQDGFQLASMIRKQNSTIPIIMLTARTLKEDLFRGFEHGADDYITKPFSIKELLLRIRAVLRRTGGPTDEAPSVFRLGTITFNHKTRQLTSSRTTRILSTKENELLRIFCQNPDTIINRSRFLIEVWGNDDYFVSKSLDVYITRLRKILADEPAVSIQNYHSVGYKLLVT